MSDILVGLGLVLVIEGLMWAIAPRKAIDMLEAAARAGEQTLRTLGVVSVAVGVLVVWLVRG